MYARILVPFDAGSTALAGLDEALRLGACCGAELRLLHVVDDLRCATGFETGAIYRSDVLPRMRSAGEQVLTVGRERAAAAGLHVETVLVEACAERAAEAIVDQAKAWGADLIVIGTHGRRGLERVLLGSDAERTVRIAPIPVLVVRSPARPAGAAWPDHTAGERARVS